MTMTTSGTCVNNGADDGDGADRVDDIDDDEWEVDDNR